MAHTAKPYIFRLALYINILRIGIFRTRARASTRSFGTWGACISEEWRAEDWQRLSENGKDVVGWENP